MSLTAIVLILISAVTHATWNLLGKRDNPSIPFFLLTAVAGTIIFSPLVLFYFDQVLMLPRQVWYFLVLSGFCQAVYFTGLAGAYRSGDMSVAYPLARSSPVIVVTFVTLILGRGSQITNQSVLGILLVMGGCFLVPMVRFSDFRLRNYLNVTCMMALMAAFGTAGYSIIDDEALRLFRGRGELIIPILMRPLVYVCLQGCLISLWLSLFVLVRPIERKSFRKTLRSGKTGPILAGGLMTLTYGLVLIAMAFVRNVSYVVAFRQVSILVGTGLGVVFLKEKLYRPRLVGVVTIFIGLILVGAG